MENRAYRVFDRLIWILGAVIALGIGILILMRPEAVHAATKHITITSGSGEKAFDGLPLTYLDSRVSEWEIEGDDGNYIFTFPNDFLPTGTPDDVMVGKYFVYLMDTSEITRPGSIDNEFSNVHIYTVKDGAKKYTDVTSDYEITENFGTLKVTSGSEDEDAGLVLHKTATADENGKVTIDLEQYMAGNTDAGETEVGKKDILIWVDYTGSMKAKLGDDSKISCLAAAKQATNRMIEQAAAINAGIENENDKIRICAVGLGGKAKAIFNFTVVTNDNMKSLQKKINNATSKDFSGNTGGSRHDLALKLCYTKFKALHDDPANADRQMVCIGVADMAVNQPVMQDGTKAADPNKDPERNTMIKYARYLKNMGVKCYSVYTANAKNNDISSKGDSLVKYKSSNLHYYVANLISSDFPVSRSLTKINEYDSTDGGVMARKYTRKPQLSEDIIVIVNDAAGLEDGGGLGLDSDAEVRDYITAPFTLTEDTVVKAYTADRISIGEDEFGWDDPVEADVTIKRTAQSVRVTGFDYEKNYVSKEPHEGTDDDYGKKLIIRFTVDPKRSFGGNQILTNEEISGIYKDTHDITDLYEAYPLPEVDIPVNYAIGAQDLSVYIPDTADVKSVVERNGAALFDAEHVPDGVNNAYVKIDYTLKDKAGKTLATMTIPEGMKGEEAAWVWTETNTLTETPDQYQIFCTVTPTAAGTYDKKNLEEDAAIHIFKPSVSFADTSQEIGEIADVTFGKELTINQLNAHQPVVTWSSADGAQSKAEDEPELTFTAEAKSGIEMVGKKAIITAVDEVPIRIQVDSGDTDITGQTVFAHECDIENCNFEEHMEDGDNFLIHVKGLLYNCDLTIKKTIKERQDAFGTPAFLFRIHGKDLRGNYHEWTSMVKIAKGLTGETKLTGLPAGKYTVEELDFGRWQTANIKAGENAKVSGEKAIAELPLDRNGGSSTVTFSNEYRQYVPGDSDVVLNHLDTVKGQE